MSAITTDAPISVRTSAEQGPIPQQTPVMIARCPEGSLKFWKIFMILLSGFNIFGVKKVMKISNQNSRLKVCN